MYSSVTGFIRKTFPAPVAGFSLLVRLLPILFVAASLWPRCPRAEAVTFSGKVVDAAGTAIPWALLQLEDGNLIGQSGPDGSFNLAGDAAAVFFYPDPEPELPFAGHVAPAAASGPPDRYLLTGRLASGSRLSAALLLAAPTGDGSGGRLFPSAGVPRKRPPASASLPERPPTPPTLHKAAAVHNLTVRMANYQAETFPQTAPSAKGLVLALSKSATDTARYAAEKRLCLDTINAYRAKAGLEPVAWSRSLEAFADQGARYDSERDSAHAHFGAFSQGAVPADAENVVPGWQLKSFKTVAAVVAAGAKMMWDEGPGGAHYENIKGSHTQVGCGIYVTPSGNVWVIHDFR